MTYRVWNGSTIHPAELQPAWSSEQEQRAAAREQRVEDYADNLLDECKTNAEQINRNYDMYDGDLLPKLMQAIAEWNGRSHEGDTCSEKQMRKLHNILADALKEVAEGEMK